MAQLYVGSYTAEANGRGAGVTAFARNGTRLTRIGEVATPSPSYLITDPTRPLLYAVNELPEGRVGSYAIGSDGLPVPVSSQPTGGAAPCHLALRGDRLLVANYGSGSVSVHPVGPDGTIGERTDLVQHEGRGADPRRQDGPHAHQVLAGPDGYVSVVDLGVDRLLHYRPVDGRLIPAGESVLPPGAGPRHAVAGPRGRWYVAAELGSTLVTLNPSPENLVFASQQPATEAGADRDNFPSAIVLSPDARHLYLANRGANSIAVFRVADDGPPRRVGEVHCGGDWPRDLAIVDGVLFVANERSHAVVAFHLDPDTGLPRPTGDAVEVGSPTCVTPRQ